MNNSTIDVVITGELAEQVTFENACAAIASMFKLSTEQAQQLLKSAPKVVKIGLDLETAKKYQAAIEKAGVKVELRPASVTESNDQSAAPAPAAQPAVNKPVANTPTTFDGLHFEIEGRPDFSFLTVKIPAKKTLKVEASAMATMDSHLVMKTKIKGGFSRLLSGESIFMNEFTAEAGPGEIGIAPATPGDLVHRYLRGDTLYLQNSAFVACTPGVNIETKWQGLTKGFFSGESLFLIRASGEGDLWFNSYGAIIEIDVKDGYVVDTGNIVAFTEGLEYSISKVGGYKSLFFSGEGFVCRFKGEGKLWIQTRSVGAFTGWAQAYRPVKSSG
jgi:uncharacterized protein (TIGR00266 family)